MTEQRWILGIDAPFTDTFPELPEDTITYFAEKDDTGRPRFNTLPLAVIMLAHKKNPGASSFGGTIMNMVSEVAALGGRVAFDGIVGTDHYGIAIDQNMAGRGIKRISPPVAGAQSPLMYCLRVDENTTLYRRNDGDGLSMTGDNIPDTIARSKPIIAVQMRRMLEFRPELLSKIGLMRLNYGAEIAMGMQHMHRASVDKNPAVRSLFQSADYVFGNREEYEAMLDTQDPVAALEKAGNASNTLYTITCGKDPIIVMQHGKIAATMKPVETSVICSIGAGDAIMAGMLYAFADKLSNWSLDQAVHLGALCARNILGMHGGQPQPVTPGHLAHLVRQANPQAVI